MRQIKPWVPGPMTIRVRLGVAMAIALLPVLLLGAAQSAISFHKESLERRASLSAAAERSVAAARARLDGAVVVLQTVTPGAVGVECAPRLRDLMEHTPGVINLVRLDRAGRVECAADSVMGDSRRSAAPWFQRLKAGQRSSMDAAPTQAYASQPALLVAARADDVAGQFDGALAALVALPSLRPEVDGAVPADTQVALVDRGGRFVSQTRAEAFTAPPKDWLSRTAGGGAYLYYGHDRRGAPRRSWP